MEDILLKEYEELEKKYPGKYYAPIIEKPADSLQMMIQ
jgi:hypothetical protein